MALKKTEQADLRKKYGLLIEIGLILALVILIVAFRAKIRPSQEFVITEEQQEIVQIEEIEQTKQIEKPPPPPRPPVPVEVPNDEILEDEALDIDAELDLDAPLDIPPPPPSADEEEEQEPEIFIVVEQMPELVGGLKRIAELIRYPEIAKKAGVEGTVIVQFVVDENGNVRDPVVIKGVGAGLDEEALRVVKQLKFKPGMQRGKPVRVRMALPIRFELK